MSSSSVNIFSASAHPDARFARTACVPCPMTHVCVSVRPLYICVSNTRKFYFWPGRGQSNVLPSPKQSPNVGFRSLSTIPDFWDENLANPKSTKIAKKQERTILMRKIALNHYAVSRPREDLREIRVSNRFFVGSIFDPKIRVFVQNADQNRPAFLESPR